MLGGVIVLEGGDALLNLMLVGIVLLVGGVLLVDGGDALVGVVVLMDVVLLLG